jgi:hypothetical protein
MEIPSSLAQVICGATDEYMGCMATVTGSTYIHRLTDGYRWDLKNKHFLFSLSYATSIYVTDEYIVVFIGIDE